MGHWTLDDIQWDRFDPAKVDPDLLKVAKAASGGRAQPRERLANTVMWATSEAPMPWR